MVVMPSEAAAERGRTHERERVRAAGRLRGVLGAPTNDINEGINGAERGARNRSRAASRRFQVIRGGISPMSDVSALSQMPNV